MDAKGHAVEIVRTFVRKGYVAYFAGGWVRDHLLGNPSEDIDIATNAPPDVILDLFPNGLIVGLAFGVVIVTAGGHHFEVATFRRDIEYVDGRKPQAIAISTVKDDALRRDFTINGMFYDPLEHTIYDYVGGNNDIKMGIIRTIGDPQLRFAEDRLRMIRAIRFACRFGFAIDNDTQQAISDNADTLFPAVAMERIWQELNKMAKGPRFDHALIEMHRLRLLPEIFPQLIGMHLNDLKKRVATFVDFPARCPTILYLLALFSESTLDEKLELCRRLRTSNKEFALVELEEQFRNLLAQQSMSSQVEWVYFFSDSNSQLVIDVVAAQYSEGERQLLLQKVEGLKNSYAPHIARVTNRTPLVNSSLLRAEGIGEGRLMGRLLKQAEALAIIHNISDPGHIVALLRKSGAFE